MRARCVIRGGAVNAWQIVAFDGDTRESGDFRIPPPSLFVLCCFPLVPSRGAREYRDVLNDRGSFPGIVTREIQFSSERAGGSPFSLANLSLSLALSLALLNLGNPLIPEIRAALILLIPVLRRRGEIIK